MRGPRSAWSLINAPISAGVITAVVVRAGEVKAPGPRWRPRTFALRGHTASPSPASCLTACEQMAGRGGQ